MNKRRFLKLLAGLPFLPKAISKVSGVSLPVSPVKTVTLMAEDYGIHPEWSAAKYHGDWQFIVVADEANKLSAWAKRDDANN